MDRYYQGERWCEDEPHPKRESVPNELEALRRIQQPVVHEDDRIHRRDGAQQRPRRRKQCNGGLVAREGANDRLPPRGKEQRQPHAARHAECRQVACERPHPRRLPGAEEARAKHRPHVGETVGGVRGDHPQLQQHRVRRERRGAERRDGEGEREHRAGEQHGAEEHIERRTAQLHCGGGGHAGAAAAAQLRSRSLGGQREHERDRRNRRERARCRDRRAGRRQSCGGGDEKRKEGEGVGRGGEGVERGGDAEVLEAYECTARRAEQQQRRQTEHGVRPVGGGLPRLVGSLQRQRVEHTLAEEPEGERARGAHGGGGGERGEHREPQLVPPPCAQRVACFGHRHDNHKVGDAGDERDDGIRRGVRGDSGRGGGGGEADARELRGGGEGRSHVVEYGGKRGARDGSE
mmetsp:Transcript_39386/g.97635  ORF Transcript_39386/g.97635 Transcript_39386/m.97635 type:complete len:406 (-) Transcript_39386:103-1320(-)